MIAAATMLRERVSGDSGAARPQSAYGPQRITLTPGKTRQLALGGRQAAVTLAGQPDSRGRRDVVIDWAQTAAAAG